MGPTAAHLDDSAKPFNYLKAHLEQNFPDIPISECFFELSCFGPNLVEHSVELSQEHRIIEEAEAQLAERIKQAGYTLIGNHSTTLSTIIHAQTKAIVDDIVDSLNKSYLKELR